MSQFTSGYLYWLHNRSQRVSITEITKPFQSIIVQDYSYISFEQNNDRAKIAWLLGQQPGRFLFTIQWDVHCEHLQLLTGSDCYNALPIAWFNIVLGGNLVKRLV